MERRNFLRLFSGLAVSALPGFRLQEGRRDRIVVVGGGIMGASIAYHLSRRGAEVILFEKDRPADGATGKSFAWINAHFTKRPQHYHRLNWLSTLAYRHLEKELSGELKLQWGGALEWFGDPERARQLSLQVKQHQEWGYPTYLVGEEEIKKKEKFIVAGPVLAAAYSEQEGSIDPLQATEVLLEKARESGVRVEYPCEVKALDMRRGRVRGVQTSKGKFDTNLLIIACGVDTPHLAAMAGLEVPLKHSPGLLVHTAPISRYLRGVVTAPDVHMKQKLDGRIVAGAEVGPPDDETHQHLSLGPQDFQDDEAIEIHAERIKKEAGKFLPQLMGAQVERVTMGWRPLPKDGYPVVGFTDNCPNIYLAVMHSGVTLAPLIGRLATLEILDDVRVDLLSSYRLSRF